MMNRLHDTLRLHADDPDARSAIASAVDTLLVVPGGEPRLTVVLDGERLPDETIAALIGGLRRLREQGGALDVVAGGDPVRRALALTGLDRVFTPPQVEPDE